jgi:hypothetical protein
VGSRFRPLIRPSLAVSTGKFEFGAGNLASGWLSDSHPRVPVTPRLSAFFLAVRGGNLHP